MSADYSLKSYDDVPYPSGAFDQTHPRRLHTLASLFGMSPPPLASARVLELGCSTGGNLIPMALAYPNAQFIGIDLSLRQIEEGQRWAAQLKLPNLQLIHQDILRFDAEPESFDYIIAHGVFSWVPREVQDAIFAICERALSVQGVAYISYNANPGCHTRRLLRDMMRFHTREIEDPQAKMAQAKAVAAFIANSVPAHNPLYSAMLKGEFERISTLPDQVLLHDDLSDINEAFYFYQFVERASQYNLKYLSEALFADMQDQMYPPHVQKILRRTGDLILSEQYMDFLSCRSFRQTLLCRNDVLLNRRIGPENIMPMYISSNSMPVSAEPDIQSEEPEKFKNPSGVVVGMDAPLAKAALVHLFTHRPAALHFNDLFSAVLEQIRGPQRMPAEQLVKQYESDALLLGEALLSAYCGNMIDLWTEPPKYRGAAGEHPEVSVLARMQAAHGPHVTSLSHKNISIDDAFALETLKLLDGTRDRKALSAALLELLNEGRFKLDMDEEKASKEALQQTIEKKLETTLVKMARFGLLLN